MNNSLNKLDYVMSSLCWKAANFDLKMPQLAFIMA